MNNQNEEGRRPIFTIEQATVYRAAGRRFFTRKSAIKAYASERLKERLGRCDCEHDGPDGYWNICQGHSTHGQKLRQRYIRWMLRLTRKRRTGGDNA